MSVFRYRDESLCGHCIIERLIGEGRLAPAARDMVASEALWWMASTEGHDLDNSYADDADDYPRELDADQVLISYGDIDCESCGNELEADPPPFDQVKFDAFRARVNRTLGRTEAER